MRNRRVSSSVLIALLVLPSPAIPQTTPDQVLIQERTHVVLVNVVAKDKHGKPVNNLTRDDFVLRATARNKKSDSSRWKKPAPPHGWFRACPRS
jgi:hypothetical protein